MWAADGGAVIVLVEGFLSNGLGLPTEQREHAQRRSVAVPSGAAKAYVTITFAAFNHGRCRNLDEENLCRIYERRPLVCRIYPMEINPHIPLNPGAKDCPPQSWEQGPELIVGGQLADLELASLIEQSRQADRDDIRIKEALCRRLGIRTSALKGDGFTAYLPDMTAFAQALEQAQTDGSVDAVEEWQFHVSGDSVAEQMQAAGAWWTVEQPQTYAFISLRAA